MTDTADFNPTAGQAEDLAPGLRRILCPNPSAMTFRGTNTYILGTHDLAIIDPGPDLPQHLDAIMDAIGPRQRVSHIIVTHSHLDHAPLARPLSKRTGAPVLAYGPSGAGRSPIMQRLADSGLAGGGEGIDPAFSPDIAVASGDVIQGDSWSLEVIHTPGHLGNHIALAWGSACFTADHVMGWASSLVSPPDGDLSDFMASCQTLRSRNWSVFYPGHGAPIHDPAARLDWLISHRLSREDAILETLRHGALTAREIAERVYTDTPRDLLAAAERNVFAHLVDLLQRNKVQTPMPLSIFGVFMKADG